MGREKRLCGMTGNTRALFLMKDAVNRCWVFTDACVVSILDKLYGHSIIKNSRGVNRKIKKQGNFFSFRHAYESGAVQRLHSATELVKQVFVPSSQTRPASLGSRLRGLRPAARIISAPAAQKFHTCRARRVFPDVCGAWVRLSQTRNACAFGVSPTCRRKKQIGLYLRRARRKLCEAF